MSWGCPNYGCSLSIRSSWKGVPLHHVDHLLNPPLFYRWLKSIIWSLAESFKMNIRGQPINCIGLNLSSTAKGHFFDDYEAKKGQGDILQYLDNLHMHHCNGLRSCWDLNFWLRVLEFELYVYSIGTPTPPDAITFRKLKLVSIWLNFLLQIWQGHSG